MIPVNIVIGDRNYRLKISPEDEEVFRKTIKIVNEKISEFKTHFAGKDMQDYISMAVIWLATERNRSTDHIVELQDALDKIDMLERQVERHSQPKTETDTNKATVLP